MASGEIFRRDPDLIEQQVDEWAGQIQRKAERFAGMRERVEEIRVTESSADGSVRVTVASNGVPTELTVIDVARGLSPAKISSELMACLRRAQSRLPGRIQEIMLATVPGENAIVDQVVGSLAAQFPPQSEEPARREHVGGLRFGPEEADEPPAAPPPPAPPRRRPRDDDDDEWEQRSFLR